MNESSVARHYGRARLSAVVLAATVLYPTMALAEQWTLSRSVERGLEVSPSVIRSQGVVSSRQGERDAAGRWPTPSGELTFGDRLGQEQGTDRWQVQEYAITQPIPIGGRISARHRAANERVSAAGADIQLVRLEVERQITTAYYHLQSAVDRVELSEQQLERSQRFQEVASKRAPSGDISGRDATRREVLYGDAEQALAAARDEWHKAEGRLRSLLQLDAQAVLNVEGLSRPQDPPPLDELRSRIAEHPALVGANFRSRAAWAQLAQAGL